MKKEKEELVKAILAESMPNINFSENAKMRFLDRISSKDASIRQLVHGYLSCHSLDEQAQYFETIAENDLDSFTFALQEIANWQPASLKITA